MKEEETLVAELEVALRKMLKEVMKKGGKDDQGLPYSLTDKMKVSDRLLKLAAVKAKMEDDDWGKGFEETDK